MKILIHHIHIQGLEKINNANNLDIILGNNDATVTFSK